MYRILFGGLEVKYQTAMHLYTTHNMYIHHTHT